MGPVAYADSGGRQAAPSGGSARGRPPLKLNDTRAGRKGMTADVAERVIPNLSCDGFGFDCELLTACARYGIPVTFFAAAVALERNIEVAKKLAARGDEAASHGFRWSNHCEMKSDEEREAITRAIESIKRTVGTQTPGGYCRGRSVNTTVAG